MTDFRADLGQLAQLEADLRDAARAVQDRLDRLRTNLDRIAWDGIARDQFDATRARWESAADDLTATLRQLTDAVAEVRDRIARVEEDTRGYFG
ncbi:WXG100 family type VII secretion target [Asanoa sp. WMMD1127]|uniref:WXG100 family type VII secretion target n=1 Tax=Asanoa sp. WMMD1127 TaxID=3016107 RepID=UPI002416178E|nr:WXG100 family type VII secretion target [Asanoa sp. WMMD1127]MDG4825053.1 WXG100 family type VII secretion target [Asanoa sp. WMMD1127]